MHTHEYITTTTYDDGHNHNMMGVTTEDPDTPGHIHCLAGQTSLEDGHVHNYKSYTLPAFYDIHGDHYHLYNGLTDTPDGHVHGYIPDGHVHGYLAATSKYYEEYTEKCCLCIEKPYKDR